MYTCFCFFGNQTLGWWPATLPAVSIDPTSASASLKTRLNHCPHSILPLGPTAREAAVSLGRYLKEHHRHDWTPSAFTDSAESHLGPSIPSVWPHEGHLLTSKSCKRLTSQTKQRRPRGFEEVGKALLQSALWAVKTQQPTVLLPKVPPFATNRLNAVLLRR